MLINLYFLKKRFLKCVLTADNPSLRTHVSQRPTYEVSNNEFLSEEVEYTLAKLFDRFLYLIYFKIFFHLNFIKKIIFYIF